jgi:hypothetical protein
MASLDRQLGQHELRDVERIGLSGDDSYQIIAAQEIEMSDSDRQGGGYRHDDGYDYGYDYGYRHGGRHDGYHDRHDGYHDSYRANSNPRPRAHTRLLCLRNARASRSWRGAFSASSRELAEAKVRGGLPLRRAADLCGALARGRRLRWRWR